MNKSTQNSPHAAAAVSSAVVLRYRTVSLQLTSNASQSVFSTSAKDHGSILTGARSDSLESEPYHKAEGGSHVD
jgi:hypothetical protein